MMNFARDPWPVCKVSLSGSRVSWTLSSSIHHRESRGIRFLLCCDLSFHVGQVVPRPGVATLENLTQAVYLRVFAPQKPADERCISTSPSLSAPLRLTQNHRTAESSFVKGISVASVVPEFVRSRKKRRKMGRTKSRRGRWQRGAAVAPFSPQGNDYGRWGRKRSKGTAG